MVLTIASPLIPHRENPMEPMKIELTKDHLQIVGAALSELPYRVVQPVIAEINRQIAAQQEPQDKPDQSS